MSATRFGCGGGEVNGMWPRTLCQDVAPGASDDPYTRLLALVLLPKLANALTNAWEPRDPEPALRFLEAWAELLPLGVQRHVLDTLILPKVCFVGFFWGAEAWDIFFCA